MYESYTAAVDVNMLGNPDFLGDRLVTLRQELESMAFVMSMGRNGMREL